MKKAEKSVYFSESDSNFPPLTQFFPLIGDFFKLSKKIIMNDKSWTWDNRVFLPLLYSTTFGFNFKCFGGWVGLIQQRQNKVTTIHLSSASLVGRSDASVASQRSNAGPENKLFCLRSNFNCYCEVIIFKDLKVKWGQVLPII